MLGAIIGDTVGSVYEFNNIKTTDFPLFQRRSNYTDDSIMTMAVAEWLLTDPQHGMDTLEASFLDFAKRYPCPMGGYGGGFNRWLFHPEGLYDYAEGQKAETKRRPYNSFGNGAAMRCSANGWMFDTLEETERVAEVSASITHNHPEVIKGAQATAAAIFMARNGAKKDEIRRYITTRFRYDLNRTCDQIRPRYGFKVTCQESVPEAIIAFLDSNDYESTVRLAVSLGGDSDTQACIAGGIAEAFYGMPDEIIKDMANKLPPDYKANIIRLGEVSAYGCRLEQIKKCWVI